MADGAPGASSTFKPLERLFCRLDSRRLLSTDQQEKLYLVLEQTKKCPRQWINMLIACEDLSTFQMILDHLMDWLVCYEGALLQTGMAYKDSTRSTAERVIAYQRSLVGKISMIDLKSYLGKCKAERDKIRSMFNKSVAYLRGNGFPHLLTITGSGELMCKLTTQCDTHAAPPPDVYCALTDHLMSKAELAEMVAGSQQCRLWASRKVTLAAGSFADIITAVTHLCNTESAKIMRQAKENTNLFRVGKFEIQCTYDKVVLPGSGDGGSTTIPTAFVLTSDKLTGLNSKQIKIVAGIVKGAITVKIFQNTTENPMLRHRALLCPAPACIHSTIQNPILHGDTEREFATREAMLRYAYRTPIHCPVCSTLVCFACGLSHPATDCSRVDKPAMTDTELLVVGAKKCPGCNTPIQKTDGCNHMTCKRCTRHFCWTCQMLFEIPGWEQHEGCRHFG
jgi:hypothetical protein